MIFGIVVLIVAGVVVAGVVSSVGRSTGAGSSGGGAISHRVEYRFSGTAYGGSVTYSTPTGQEQRDIALPGRVTYTTGNSLQSWVSLIQNLGASGSVTCAIIVDGKTVAENTSTAAYGIASCDATTGAYQIRSRSRRCRFLHPRLGFAPGATSELVRGPAARRPGLDARRVDVRLYIGEE